MLRDATIAARNVAWTDTPGGRLTINVALRQHISRDFASAPEPETLVPRLVSYESPSANLLM